MTDEDRYGKKLGRGFVSVRGTLCSEETQADAPAKVAAYILGVVEKDVDLKTLYLQAAPAIDGFPDPATLDRIERASTESLGAQHFAQALREVRDVGEGAECILERLARLGAAATEARVTIERDYQADAECQNAFARHHDAIERELFKAMRHKCGLASAAAQKSAPDQDGLLNFVVFRE